MAVALDEELLSAKGTVASVGRLMGLNGLFGDAGGDGDKGRTISRTTLGDKNRGNRLKVVDKQFPVVLAGLDESPVFRRVASGR